MFGIFQRHQGDARLINALQYHTSLLRADLEDDLLNRPFRHGVNLLKLTGAPAAIAYFEAQKMYSGRRATTLRTALEDESFVYLFAKHLRHKIADPESVRRAKHEFHRSCDEVYSRAIERFFDAREASERTVQMFGSMSADQYAALMLILSVLVSPDALDDTHLMAARDGLAPRLFRWRETVKVQLQASA